MTFLSRHRFLLAALARRGRRRGRRRPVALPAVGVHQPPARRRPVPRRAVHRRDRRGRHPLPPRQRGRRHASSSPRRWAAASRSSTTTATAGRTCSSSTPARGPAPVRRPADAGPLPQPGRRHVRGRDRRGRPRRRRCTAWASPSATSTTTAGRTCSSPRVGGDRLFRNVGGKRFEDVTDRGRARPAGALPDVSADEFHKWDTPIPFPSSATFLDYDGDGRLDLFVCRYVTWSPGRRPRRARRPARRRRGRTSRRRSSPGRTASCTATSAAAVRGRVGDGRRAGQRPGRPRRRAGADRQGAGRGRVRPGRRRLAGPGRRQRHGPELLLPQRPGPDGGRRFEEVGLTANVAYAEGRPRGGMGIDCRRGPAGQLAVGDRQLHQRAEHPAGARVGPARSCSATRRRPRGWPGRAAGR